MHRKDSTTQVICELASEGSLKSCWGYRYMRTLLQHSSGWQQTQHITVIDDNCRMSHPPALITEAAVQPSRRKQSQLKVSVLLALMTCFIYPGKSHRPELL